MTPATNFIAASLEDVSSLDAIASLTHLRSMCRRTLVFSTSFGKEDQVITDMIYRMGGGIRIFTLDTGRLFAETYAVWSTTMERYGMPITVQVPDQQVPLRGGTTQSVPQQLKR